MSKKCYIILKMRDKVDRAGKCCICEVVAKVEISVNLRVDQFVNV